MEDRGVYIFKGKILPTIIDIHKCEKKKKGQDDSQPFQKKVH